MLTDCPQWFQVGYGASYLFLVRHVPWVWKFSYYLLELRAVYRLVQPLRRLWNLFIARRFMRRLRLEQPDAVIVTHFLPADLCSAAKRSGWWQGKLVVVVTDFHAHRFWISPELEAMVVSSAEGAKVLEGRGVPPSRIYVRGIPISHVVSAVAEREQLQQRFGLDPSRLTLLITSGGTTVGKFEQVVDAVLSLESSAPGRLQLLVVCGEDERVYQRLSARMATEAMPLRVFGFINYMAELMAVSDLVISKAGGLTVSEALAAHRPLVLYHVIPGQEQVNAQHVALTGAAIIANRPEEVAAAVRRCLEEPEQLAAMQEAAKTLGRPHAAAEIVSQVVAPLLAHSTGQAHG